MAHVPIGTTVTPSKALSAPGDRSRELIGSAARDGSDVFDWLQDYEHIKGQINACCTSKAGLVVNVGCGRSCKRHPSLCILFSLRSNPFPFTSFSQTRVSISSSICLHSEELAHLLLEDCSRQVRATEFTTSVTCRLPL